MHAGQIRPASFHILYTFVLFYGQDSSVGIATGYGLDQRSPTDGSREHSGGP
jgi:hypothetical protein